MRFAENMIAVAVGWQVYAIHKNPLDLGLVGLCEFVPLPLLALPAGHLADRLPRRLHRARSSLAMHGRRRGRAARRHAAGARASSGRTSSLAGGDRRRERDRLAGVPAR